MENKVTLGGVLKFIIPSIAGILLLMTPFQINGQSTVIVSLISTFLQSLFSTFFPIYVFVLIVVTISFLLSLIYKIAKPAFIENSPTLKSISDVSGFWFIVRTLGFVVGFAIAFGSRLHLPEILWGPNTGGLILFDLLGGLFTIFLVAGFVLPLLTEFGLLEFIGVFLTPIMRPVFKLPGRSAVDCVASWVGDSTIGVTLTNKQYLEGHYNAREAAVISTTFSAVSITFCLVVLENVNMLNYFGQFYLTVAIVGIVCALIVPRIPPLSRKKETYLPNERPVDTETIPAGYTKFQWAMKLSTEKGIASCNLKHYFSNGFKTVVNLWLGVIPSIIAIGTFVLIIAEVTPIFDWLGMPFEPLLRLMQVPLAHEASKTMIVGFGDMVVPSLMAAEIANPMTQFIIAVLSVTQLIYMSETGAVILASNLPVNFLDLFVIFIERTIVALPVIVLMAHIFF